MPASSILSSLLWFVAIVALIPLALWLVKRTPMGGTAGHGVTRLIAALPLSTSQRVVTIEVGHGETRRWLVLGVTGESITKLHEMAPLDEGLATTQPAAPFSQLLACMQPKSKDAKDDDAR